MSVHQIKIILQKQNSIVHHITANIAGDQLNSNLKKKKKRRELTRAEIFTTSGNFTASLMLGNFKASLPFLGEGPYE